MRETDANSIIESAASIGAASPGFSGDSWYRGVGSDLPGAALIPDFGMSGSELS